MTKAERQQLMNTIIEEYKNTPDNKNVFKTQLKNMELSMKLLKNICWQQELKGSTKAFKVAEILYKDNSICLERKYNIYLNMNPPKSKDLGNKLDKNGEDCDVNTVLNSEIA